MKIEFSKIDCKSNRAILCSKIISLFKFKIHCITILNVPKK